MNTSRLRKKFHRFKHDGKKEKVIINNVKAAKNNMGTLQPN